MNQSRTLHNGRHESYLLCGVSVQGIFVWEEGGYIDPDDMHLQLKVVT